MTATTWQRAQRVPLELSSHLSSPTRVQNLISWDSPIQCCGRVEPCSRKPHVRNPHARHPCSQTDQEKTTAAEAGIGRRAMDPLPSRYAEPAVRLEPAAPAAPTPSVTSPQPRRSAHLPSFEPVIERAPANGHGTSPDNPSPARPQPPQPPAPVAPPRVSMPSPVPTAPLVSPRLTPASANVPPPPMSGAATQAATASPPLRQAASVTPPVSAVTPTSSSVPTPAPASWRVPTPRPTSQPAPATSDRRQRLTCPYGQRLRNRRRDELRAPLSRAPVRRRRNRSPLPPAATAQGPPYAVARPHVGSLIMKCRRSSSRG